MSPVHAATTGQAMRLSQPDALAQPAALERAILRTLAYADLFDYPLTAAEIRRYLIGVPATVQRVEDLLAGKLQASGWLETSGGYFALYGRRDLFELRDARGRWAAELWSRARRYGRRLAQLPFVRMVAVTGALAMDNEPGRDLDYLVVTAPGRLWFARGLAMLWVRAARRSGDVLCPNYFISTRALVFSGQNLYAAHELAQMVPLSGLSVYGAIRRLNPWVYDYLPNAEGLPRPEEALQRQPSVLLGAVEALLPRLPVERLERWERQRKIKKLNAQAAGDRAEADFSSDWCKGHFGGYGAKTLQSYTARLKQLGI